MRFAAVDGRAVVVVREHGDAVEVFDVETDSRGLFSSDPQEVFKDWHAFRAWSAAHHSDTTFEVSHGALSSPVGRPGQVFAIGLNYRAHAEETGHPTEPGLVPPTFTKFPSSITGPNGPLEIGGDTVDWEVELVVVVGARADRVSAAEAYSFVAGYTVGQDYSDRTVQRAGSAPQYSLGKSFRGYGPIGPWVVTGEEIEQAGDLAIVCEVNGEQVQVGRTSDLIWSVPALIECLSNVCTLLPGDLIFTGTPSGVGVARTPPQFLKAGDEVVSRIEGIGELRQHVVDERSSTGM